MATILAQTLIDRSQTLIQDQLGTRWPAPELLNWLNDGQREVVLLKPDAHVKNEAVQMQPGTKQNIPPSGNVLIDVRRNMGANGVTPGRAITLTDRRILDEQLRDWHFAAENSIAIHYIFDPADPKHFYLYPAQPSPAHYVELIYSAAPDDVVDPATGTISIDDIYSNALVDYIVYRAYSKDADYAANDGRANQHYNRFLIALGLKAQGQDSISPVRREG